MNELNPMVLRFSHIPLEYIPEIGTSSYELFVMLCEGKPIERWQPSLGESMRSALQMLRGDRLGHWRIHSVKVNGKRQTLLLLDPRHLSGDSKQDRAARRERKSELKRASYNDAELGHKRLQKAYREMSEALKEYFMGLGVAANDSKK
jgi:hypothetical protein